MMLDCALGQQVLVDNRAGAGGTVGAELGVKAPADGYTLTLIAASYTVGPSMCKLTFDRMNDITPVMLAAPDIPTISESGLKGTKSSYGTVSLRRKIFRSRFCRGSIASSMRRLNRRTWKSTSRVMASRLPEARRPQFHAEIRKGVEVWRAVVKKLGLNAD
ncbi:MAG: putative exported protein [Betaproteobacteria bacterium]|nr:putative exported protein [Betaproteobacteria bacterium]